MMPTTFDDFGGDFNNLVGPTVNTNTTTGVTPGRRMTQAEALDQWHVHLMRAGITAGNPDAISAGVTRDQWQHFLDVYRPVEDQALQRAMQTDFTREGDEAGRLAQTAVRTSRGILQRNLRRSGATLTAEERKALDRRQSLNLTRTAARAENTARRGLKESRERLLQSVVGLGRGVAQTAAGGLSDVADSAAARQAAYQSQKAQARNANLSTAASVASLIIALY